MFFGNPSLLRLPLTLSPNSSRLAQSFSVSLVQRTSRRPLDTPAHSHSLELPSPAAFRLLTFNFRPLTVAFSKRRRMNTYTKSANNSRRISTSNLLDLNLSRMNTYKKFIRGTVIMTYSQLRGEHIPELDIVPYLMQAPKGRNNVAQCGSTGNDSKTNSSPDGRHKIRNSEVS